MLQEEERKGPKDAAVLYTRKPCPLSMLTCQKQKVKMLQNLLFVIIIYPNSKIILKSETV